jgi:polysaccharide deacetylase family protein (PEP-CTERM system associated)
MSVGAGSQNAFTVDLEEWFHICGVPSLAFDAWPRLPSRVEATTRRVLELLAAADITATFFVVGWVAERHPDLIQEIVRAGHEIGSHGYRHERVYELGPERFKEDLRASVAALERVNVDHVRLFRAPEWSLNATSLWALDDLIAERFTLDASMAPLRMVGDTAFPRYPHWKRTSTGLIREVPPLVADRFGQVMPMGWGWGLRMSSPARVLRLVESENRAGRPAVFTVHPWELDPDPPRVRLPARLHFAHYFRLEGFHDRLRQILMSGIPFGPIGQVVVAGDAV